LSQKLVRKIARMAGRNRDQGYTEIIGASRNLLKDYD